MESNIQKKSCEAPKLLEKVLGYTQIGVLLWQLVSKSISKRLIFIISPCHLVTLIQVFLFLGTYSRSKEYIYLCMMGFNWAPILAIVFPAPGNLMLPGDSLLFWIQHYSIGIVSPIVLNYYGRFSQSYQLNLKAILCVGVT